MTGSRQPRDFAKRIDSAERLHRERPVRRLGHLMNPAVVVVGDRDEGKEFLELGESRLLTALHGQSL